MSRKFVTDPPFQQGPNVGVSAILDSLNGELEVVIVLGRAKGLQSMDASEVEAELVDSSGTALPATARPHGPLPEGGGLGVSVNAPFRFRLNGRTPAQLKVRYHGTTYAFQIKEAA